MKFLRGLLGETRDAPAAAPIDPEEPDAEEHEHELDLARGEQDRLDELAQRQLKYERYAWKPPAQGGERRADDTDEPKNSG